MPFTRGHTLLSPSDFPLRLREYCKKGLGRMPQMKDTEKREISLRYDTTVANVASQQLWLPAWGLDKTEPIDSQDGFMGSTTHC